MTPTINSPLSGTKKNNFCTSAERGCYSDLSDASGALGALGASWVPYGYIYIYLCMHMLAT